MAPQKDLSIIIINFNQTLITARCLESIYKNTSDLEVEVIVVDNGSAFESLRELKSFFPQVEYLELPENVGYSRANNLGAGRATAECLLFLNNDTLISEGILKKMVDFLKSHPQVGACGVRLENEAGAADLACANSPRFLTEVFSSCGLDKSFKKSSFFNPYYRNYWLLKEPVEVAIISGADLMVVGKVFQEVGGFDENFFFYYEDADFCLKVRKAGYKIFYMPQLKINHLRGATIEGFSSKKFLEWRKSRLYFYKKNYSRGEFVMVKIFMLVTLLIRFIIFPILWLGRFL